MMLSDAAVVAVEACFDLIQMSKVPTLWGIDCCLASAWRPQTTTRITGVSFKSWWLLWLKLHPTWTFTATLNSVQVHLYQALEDVTHAPAQISQTQEFKKLTALRTVGVKQANEVCLPVDICTTTGRSQSGKKASWSDASLAGRSPYCTHLYPSVYLI